MIRLICPLLLISTILCAHLHADTDATKTPAPAKSFPFAPPGTIKPGAYDVKLQAKAELLIDDTGSEGTSEATHVNMNNQGEYTVTVAPANKKQEQVLELTYQRLQDSKEYATITTEGSRHDRTESFDSRHPKQAKGMKCIEKRMSVVGKKARWTLCKSQFVKRDGFKQLRHKAEPPADDEVEWEAYNAASEAYQDAMEANSLIGFGEDLFPQYTRTLLPVKPAKVGDTWKRKVDLSPWLSPSAGATPLLAKVIYTLSKVEGTVATIAFSIEIPPCTYTTDGRTTSVTGKEKGKGSLQYDLATQMIMTEQVAFTIKTVSHEKKKDINSKPTTMQFQRTITITPKKAKTKAKPAPTKKPAN